MNGPEKEEDHKHVMSVPEALIVSTSRLFDRGDDHSHERSQHDVSSPARTRHKVGQQPSVDAQVILGGDLSKVDPMGNRVDPREEDDGPCRGDVEGDILVELDDSVERRLSSQGDERSANREKNEGDIDVENQSGRTRDHESRPKGISSYLQVFLDGKVDEAEREQNSVEKHEYENEDSSVAFVNHPSVKLFSWRKFFLSFLRHLTGEKHSREWRPS